MVETRLRGQEVNLILARGNTPEDTVTAIRDFTAQFEFRTLAEGYLGELTMRHDDIYDGVSGSFTVDLEDQSFFTLINFIKERAQRVRGVNVSRVNAAGRFTFPNGQTPRLIIRDLKFDAIPLNVGSRDAYA